MPTEAVYKPVPFQEAIDSFQRKLRLPSRHYSDVLEDAHTRGFMVAGAMQDDLLAGFQEAINRALAQGTTLAEFRKDFDRLVKVHGWSYNGTPGWRSRVIFETNLRTSAMSGKWKQAQRSKKTRPYGRYIAVNDRRTRPEHSAWHGMLVHLDDPWWNAHWPPNGWGCRCSVQTVSERERESEGWEVSEPPPDKPCTVQLRGPDGPVPVQTVPGVDPGWAYNPGKAGSGNALSPREVASLKAERTWEDYRRAPAMSYRDYGLPATLPERAARATLAAKAQTEEQARAALESLLGGPEKTFSGPDGADVLLIAALLAAHHPERSAYYPFLRELIEAPEEIWLSLDTHIPTGRVELRKRYLKLLRMGAGKQAMYLVAESKKGTLTAWTLVPLEKAANINKQRIGKLLWHTK